MAQDYKLTSFEASDFRDNNGNFWCTAVFEGTGEPVKWVVKDPTKVKVGESYYGEIRDWQSSTGRTWPRFYKEQRQDYPQSHGGSQPNKPAYQPKDDNAIRAQWAIGQSVAAHVSQNGANGMSVADFDSIESYAKSLYGMVERVKGNLDTAVEVTGGEEISLDDIPF